MRHHTPQRRSSLHRDNIDFEKLAVGVGPPEVPESFCFSASVVNLSTLSTSPRVKSLTRPRYHERMHNDRMQGDLIVCHPLLPASGLSYSIGLSPAGKPQLMIAVVLSLE